MKVKKFINRAEFSCNVYVCSTEKCNFIVDLGYFDAEIDNYLKTLPAVDFVLQTHGHFDHIMGLNAFHKRYEQVPVYFYESEIDVCQMADFNGSFMTGCSYAVDFPVESLAEGQKIIKGQHFQVIHTPGHTEGSCMFSFPEDKVLFTGDTIIENSIGRTDLPTGNEEAIFRSLRKFSRLVFDPDTMVYFGHGDDYDYHTLKKQNPFIR